MLKFAIPYTIVMAAAMTPPAMAYQQDKPAYNVPISSNLERSVSQRSGPKQRQIELAQTTLLNQFGGLGFSKLISFDKVGSSYVAVVETVRGDDVTVTIDPFTGKIIGIDPFVAVVVQDEAIQ
jgi:hypothetical protein